MKNIEMNMESNISIGNITLYVAFNFSLVIKKFQLFFWLKKIE